MFRKLLLCTDLSPASDALVQCAGELKGIGVAEIVLTHVIYVANTPGLEELLAEEARPALERQRKMLEDQGMQVTVEMPIGVPPQTLAETADRLGASAILIGSHSKSPLHSATLGSVSGRLLHLTSCAVFLARTAVLDDGKASVACRRLLENILFPTDFSEAAEQALPFVGKIAAATKAPVTLLHVVESQADHRTLSEEDSRLLLESKKRRLESVTGFEVNAILVTGDPVREIVATAREGKFSLVVVASHGKAPGEELIHGSVANAVARQADAPILYVPLAD